MQQARSQYLSTLATIPELEGSLRQAHQPDEFVSIEQLHQATRAFALTIVRLLGTP